jgi:RimJ/RimL family protein N-acetyltransferase
MGFEFVELTLHPEISLDNPPRKFEPRVAMRNADSTDLDLLLSESQEAFQYSRFFRDTQIPRHAAGARFREWVRAGLESEDKDLLIFSDEQGTPIAFFLVKPVGSDCFLELTSILAASRGKSLATLVWETFLASAENRGFKKIRTNISGENSAVVALYPKLGFLLREPSVAFHFHSSELSK